MEAITGLSRREGERSARWAASHPAMQTPVAPHSRSASARPQEPAYGSAAAQLYSKGDAAGLAALAKAARDPDERLALEWASLRSDAHLHRSRALAAVRRSPSRMARDGGWDSGAGAKGNCFVNSEAPAKVAGAYFASEPPQSSAGMIAAARAANATVRSDEGVTIVRALWRDGDFDFSTETLILRGIRRCSLHARADHRHRADPSALRREFRARVARGRDCWPRNLRPGAGPDRRRARTADPGACHGRSHRLPQERSCGSCSLAFGTPERSNRAYARLAVLPGVGARRDRRGFEVNPDRWWSERRKVAGDNCSISTSRASRSNFATTWFQTGRFRRPGRPPTSMQAGSHCVSSAVLLAPQRSVSSGAAQVAQTPISIARAAYWRGRAAEAARRFQRCGRSTMKTAVASEANRLLWPAFCRPASWARKRLALRAPIAAAEGDRRDEAGSGGRGSLHADGLDELALRARLRRRPAMARTRLPRSPRWPMQSAVSSDAATEVVFGKIATHRGYATSMRLTFPISGLCRPSLPLPHSADLASIYAVARQESEFLWQDASSGRGAKGLMQLLPSTAASTAHAAPPSFRLRAPPRRSGLQHSSSARPSSARVLRGGRGRLVRLGQLAA